LKSTRLFFLGSEESNGHPGGARRPRAKRSAAARPATVTCLHLSVHRAPPARPQAGQPMSSAECLMHSDAHASHPPLPRPAVNVGGSAHNAAPSAHAIYASVSGEMDVVAD